MTDDRESFDLTSSDPGRNQAALARIASAARLGPQSDWTVSLELLQDAELKRDIAAAIAQPRGKTQKALEKVAAHADRLLKAMAAPALLGRLAPYYAETAARLSRESRLQVEAIQTRARPTGVGLQTVTIKALATAYEGWAGLKPTVISDGRDVADDGEGDAEPYGPFVDFCKATYREFGWGVITGRVVRTEYYG